MMWIEKEFDSMVLGHFKSIQTFRDQRLLCDNMTFQQVCHKITETKIEKSIFPDPH